MIRVSERSYSLLIQQKGELVQFVCGETPDAFVQAYNMQLADTMGQIEKLSPFPSHVLDIGSGLGGIDVLLVRRYACHVTLIDGEYTTPQSPIKHDVPFCSRHAVDAFMEDNEIERASYDYCNPAVLASGPFDLVLSLRSWLFHYGPEQYLDYVAAETKPGSLLIADVRLGKEDWLAKLHTHFAQLATIERGSKYDRIVFERRWELQ